MSEGVKMEKVLKQLGMGKQHEGAFNGDWIKGVSGSLLPSISPIDGKTIAKVKQAGAKDYEKLSCLSRNGQNHRGRRG